MSSEPPDHVPTLSTQTTAGTDAPEWAEPPPRVGRYTLEREIGRGGMGVVYRAFDPDLSRAVALKLIDAGAESDARGARRRDRLLREAQALARLSHPNVVPVFDVGRFESSVFLTMELVDGVTLRRWLAAAPRTYRETLALYLAAGEGLAAAHAAGIVHRDFKPDNVIVGHDGRVRVLDFGLARAAAGFDLGTSGDSSTDGTLSNSSLLPPSLSSSSVNEGVMAISASSSRLPPGLEAALTEDGALIGTPTYMSPEQLLRYRVDARSDQYGFCVALYEALYGRRPFAGMSAADRRRAVLNAEPVLVPGRTRVPPRIFRALARGLAILPGDRHASMEDLLAALRRDPVRVASRWAPLAAGAVALVAAVGVRAAHRAPQPCKGAEAKVAAVWNAEARARIGAAFAATGATFATDARRVVETAIDSYTSRWARAHEDACEATRIRGEQSEAMLDLRMVCLDRRISGLRAELEVLASADKKVVERAANTVAALPSLEACSDRAALEAVTALPSEPTARARIEALGTLAARADALTVAGRAPAAADLATQVLKGARDEQYKPLEAEAHFILGAAASQMGIYDRAGDELEEAARLGLASRRDDVLARALTTLLYVRGEGQTRFDDAARIAKEAQAAVERTQRVDLEADLSSILSATSFRAGKYVEAKEHALRTLGLCEKTRGPSHYTVGEALVGLANATASLGDLDGAEVHYNRARIIFAEALGKSHPRMAGLINNIANVNHLRGREKEAVDGFGEALALWEASLGPEHPSVATAHSNLAAALQATGHLDEAVGHFREAREIYVRRLGPDHPDVALVEFNLGAVACSKGNMKEGLAYYEKALPILEKAHDPAASSVMMNTAYIHYVARRDEQAIVFYRRAAAFREEIFGKAHPLLGEALFMVGNTMTWAGRPAEALPYLERALSILEDPAAPAFLRAQAPIYLAQALAESGRDVRRARELAAKAAVYAREAGERGEETLAYAEAFLRDGTVRKRFPR